MTVAASVIFNTSCEFGDPRLEIRVLSVDGGKYLKKELIPFARRVDGIWASSWRHQIVIIGQAGQAWSTLSRPVSSSIFNLCKLRAEQGSHSKRSNDRSSDRTISASSSATNYEFTSLSAIHKNVFLFLFITFMHLEYHFIALLNNPTEMPQISESWEF